MFVIHKESCLTWVTEKLLVLVLIIVASIYFLGVRGGFLLDDFHNLSGIAIYGGVNDVHDVLRYMFGQNGDQIARSIPRLTFLLNAQNWPSDPLLFKVTNIALHSLCGIFVFLFTASFTRIATSRDHKGIALVAVALWLLASVHVSTVLYVVQRMTVLMALFSVASLYFYLVARVRDGLAAYIWGGVSFLCVLCAGLSKENAAVLLILIPLTEWFLRTQLRDRPLVFSISFYAMPVVFAGMFAVAVVANLDHFEARGYQWWERFLAQGPILIEYLVLIVQPFYDYTIFHDSKEFNLSNQSLFLGFVAWVMHLLIIITCFYHASKKRLWAYGVIFYYLSHIIESTLIPLELMFEHRNYLPSVGIFLCLSVGFFEVFRFLSRRFGSKTGPFAIVSLYPLILIAMLLYNTALWKDWRVLSSKWAADYPESLRAQSFFISMLVSNGFEKIAVDTLREKEDIFEDVSLRLQRVYLECKIYGQAEEFSPGSLVDVNFSSGVLHVLETMVSEKGESAVCLERSLNGGITALIGGISKMALLQNKPGYLARFYDVSGDYFVESGQYKEAVTAREKAAEVQPTISTFLKAAELFILGGNTLLATSYLERAYSLEEQRWFSDSDAKAAIDRLWVITKELEGS